MFTLAHLTDVHLAPLPVTRLTELAGKRIIGFHSWRFRRFRIHKRDVADMVRADILASQPDHVALTGDLINIALEREFRAALTWLEDFGPSDWLTFVPGNHDTYVPFSWDRGMGLWGNYMTGDLRLAGARGTGGLANPFPFVRQRRNIALIGVSTAIPTAIGLATGRMGTAQIEALAQILADLRQRGFYRILLIHHPPAPGLTKPRRELTDAPDLMAVLAQEGADLVLYGHIHEHGRLTVDSRHGPVHVISAPSASSDGSLKTPAAWYRYRIERQDGRWLTEVSVRSYDRRTRSMRNETRFDLRHG